MDSRDATRARLALIFSLCLFALPRCVFPEAEPKRAVLATRLQEIAADFPGTVGVYTKNIETGEDAKLNADKTFPMASTFKVPVMVQIFRDVDAGKISLDERVELTAENRRPGSGLLHLMAPGLKPTINDLLYFMITISDNEAADILLERAGAERVTATVRSFGINDLRVDRSTAQLIRNWIAAPNKTFVEDKRDQSSPRAMADLLIKIQKGEAASPDSCKKMIGILKEQEFNQRIPRYLPPGTPVAHKTGTIGFTTNDAGIIEINKQHVVLAVFTLKSNLDVSMDSSESTIAKIGRAVYDYFSAKE